MSTTASARLLAESDSKTLLQHHYLGGEDSGVALGELVVVPLSGEPPLTSPPTGRLMPAQSIPPLTHEREYDARGQPLRVDGGIIPNTIPRPPPRGRMKCYALAGYFCIALHVLISLGVSVTLLVIGFMNLTGRGVGGALILLGLPLSLPSIAVIAIVLYKAGMCCRCCPTRRMHPLPSLSVADLDLVDAEDPLPLRARCLPLLHCCKRMGYRHSQSGVFPLLYYIGICAYTASAGVLLLLGMVGNPTTAGAILESVIAVLIMFPLAAISGLFTVGLTLRLCALRGLTNCCCCKRENSGPIITSASTATAVTAPPVLAIHQPATLGPATDYHEITQDL